MIKAPKVQLGIMQRWLGGLAGVLLVRLVLLLFAARPSNPVVAVWLTLSAPLVWPWTLLDRWAGQPRFGARLELGTLAVLVIIGVVLMVVAAQEQGGTNE
ncbi:MAG: hypothetical protein NVS4B8_12120 [Herpetosiphon sp.]